MSNVFLTPSMITLEALDVLVNELNFTRRIRREYDDRFGNDGAKIGDTISVRKPPRFLGRRGPALAVEDIVQTSVPVVLNQQYGCDVNFTSKDLALSIERFREDILGPEVCTIANMIDSDGLKQYVNVANYVGSPGTTPNALLTYLQAGVELDNEATPMDSQRFIVVNPLMQATIVDALKGLFQSSDKIAKQYEKGKMGIAAGFEWYMDQNVFPHTSGAQGGTPLINGANQTGTSINLKGWTASTGKLKAGDILTFAGTSRVNPQNRVSTNDLRKFVVLADATADGSGNMTVTVFPALTPSGAQQTVTASPADGAAVTVFASASQVTPQGLAFHRNAFTFACADLPMPRGIDMSARIADDQTNISMRLARQYDVNNDKFPCRLDVLGGWATLRGENACRISA